MLPKSKRIPREKFSLLKEKATTFKNSLFLLRFVEIKDIESRFAFSVSKKISKSAVVRNKLRRVGYRLLKPFVLSIKPKILVSFSYLRLPKDEKETLENLQSIIKHIK